MSASCERSDPPQTAPTTPPRITLRRFLVWLLLVSILSSFFVSVRFPPLAYVTLIGTFAMLSLWECLKKALRRSFAVSVDTTWYAFAAAATIYVAREIDLALFVPEDNPIRFLFRFREILGEAIGQAISIALALLVCHVVAILGAAWTIVGYVVQKVLAWRRKRREARRWRHSSWAALLPFLFRSLKNGRMSAARIALAEAAPASRSLFACLVRFPPV